MIGGGYEIIDDIAYLIVDFKWLNKKKQRLSLFDESSNQL